jgi:uncharacterized protein (PEP-CTERM system associated)
MGVAFSRDEFPDTGRTDDLTFFWMGLSRQIQPRVSGSLDYRRSQNDSNQSASNYAENSVTAVLQMRF